MIWDFEVIVNANEVVTSGILDRLRVGQRVCVDGSKALLMTIVEVIRLA